MPDNTTWSICSYLNDSYRLLRFMQNCVRESRMSEEGQQCSVLFKTAILEALSSYISSD